MRAQLAATTLAAAWKYSRENHPEVQHLDASTATLSAVPSTPTDEAVTFGASRVSVSTLCETPYRTLRRPWQRRPPAASSASTPKVQCPLISPT